MQTFTILADTQAVPNGQAAAPSGGPVAPAAAGTTTVTPTGAQTGSPQSAEQGGGGWSFLIMMGILFALMYLLIIRPKKKEDQAKAALLKALKKGDKVMTIGGEIGTIMDLREDEVVLKVDESTNTRIRYARGAISRVLGEETSGK